MSAVYCGKRMTRGGTCGRPREHTGRCRSAESVQVNRDRIRAHRAANPDVIAERNRAYRAKNHDAVTEHKRAYYAANRAAITAYKRDYYAANRDAIAEATREYKRERREFWRGLTDWWKLTHGCENCGYGKHGGDWQLYRWQAAALDLDHIDPATKVANVSRLLARTKCTEEEFIAEVAKCRVLCANCHRIKTVANRDHTRQLRAEV